MSFRYISAGQPVTFMSVFTQCSAIGLLRGGGRRLKKIFKQHKRPERENVWKYRKHGVVSRKVQAVVSRIPRGGGSPESTLRSPVFSLMPKRALNVSLGPLEPGPQEEATRGKKERGSFAFRKTNRWDRLPKATQRTYDASEPPPKPTRDRPRALVPNRGRPAAGWATRVDSMWAFSSTNARRESTVWRDGRTHPSFSTAPHNGGRLGSTVEGEQAIEKGGGFSDLLIFRMIGLSTQKKRNKTNIVQGRRRGPGVLRFWGGELGRVAGALGLAAAVGNPRQLELLGAALARLDHLHKVVVCRLGASAQPGTAKLERENEEKSQCTSNAVFEKFRCGGGKK